MNLYPTINSTSNLLFESSNQLPLNEISNIKDEQMAEAFPSYHQYQPGFNNISTPGLSTIHDATPIVNLAAFATQEDAEMEDESNSNIRYQQLQNDYDDDHIIEDENISTISEDDLMYDDGDGEYKVTDQSGEVSVPDDQLLFDNKGDSDHEDLYEDGETLRANIQEEIIHNVSYNIACDTTAKYIEMSSDEMIEEVLGNEIIEVDIIDRDNNNGSEDEIDILEEDYSNNLAMSDSFLSTDNVKSEKNNKEETTEGIEVVSTETQYKDAKDENDSIDGNDNEVSESHHESSNKSDEVDEDVDKNEHNESLDSGGASFCDGDDGEEGSFDEENLASDEGEYFSEIEHIVPIFVFSQKTESILFPFDGSTDVDVHAYEPLFEDTNEIEEVSSGTIEEFFSHMRFRMAEWIPYEDNEELVLEIPELKLKINEDNVYAKDLTVTDIISTFNVLRSNTKEDLAPKALRFIINTKVRFIGYYNLLSHLVENSRGFDSIPNHYIQDDPGAHDNDSSTDILMKSGENASSIFVPEDTKVSGKDSVQKSEVESDENHEIILRQEEITELEQDQEKDGEPKVLNKSEQDQVQRIFNDSASILGKEKKQKERKLEVPEENEREYDHELDQGDSVNSINSKVLEEGKETETAYELGEQELPETTGDDKEVLAGEEEEALELEVEEELIERAGQAELIQEQTQRIEEGEEEEEEGEEEEGEEEEGEETEEEREQEVKDVEQRGILEQYEEQGELEDSEGIDVYEDYEEHFDLEKSPDSNDTKEQQEDREEYEITKEVDSDTSSGKRKFSMDEITQSEPKKVKIS